MDNNTPKKVLIAAIGFPSSDGTAGQAVMEGLVKSLKNAGYVVDFIAVDIRELGVVSGPSKSACEKNLNILEIKARPNRRGGKIRRVIHMSDQSYSYQFDSRGLKSVRDTVKSFDYTAAIFFESVTFPLSDYVASEKKIFIQGDPCGERYRFGLRRTQLVSHMVGFLMAVGEGLFLKRISKDGTIGLFGTEHAKRLSTILKKPVLDLRPWLSTTINETTSDEGRVGKIIYYFGGTLEGTASRFALKILCEHTIPLIKRVHGANGYEMRIVGRSNEKAIMSIGDNSQVTFTGFVKSFPSELAKGDVFIFVSEYWVGVRTRVCDALGAGLICVVHESIFRNMPELKDCRAVLACSDMPSVERVLRKVVNLSGAERESLRVEAIKHYKHNYACCREGSLLGLLGGEF